MKKTVYFIKGIVGITALLFFISCNQQAANNEQPIASGDENAVLNRLPVAYINTDSLLRNYQFVTDWNEKNLKKLEDKRLSINRRAEKWQKEVLEFQEKAQMNAFYSTERRQQEQTRLERQQQELEQAAAQAEQEMAVDQMNMNQQLQDTLDVAIKEFNKGKYQAIFSNAGASTFFYIDESYDITKEVIDFLNARYTPVSE